MQIFLSHSSHQKPLIREIRKHLPPHLSPWIDEEKLLIGDDITISLETAICTASDYLLLFIDDYAVKSPWVEKEISWALETEKTYGRTILLPIVIEEAAFYKILRPELSSRKYLTLKDFLEESVKLLAECITSELFALVCRDYSFSQNPKPVSLAGKMLEAEHLLREQADLIQKAVFPHRKANPITTESLLRVLNSQSGIILSVSEIESILIAVMQRNLVPGLDYDGYKLYVVEEHSSWKSRINEQAKANIGSWVASQIMNGHKILIDAGSTCEQVVERICKRIETRSITRLSIATTSINIADMISDCCVSMGFDDDFSAVRLYVLGGQVRPATQAVVPFLDVQKSQIERLADAIGGFDLGLVGVNGVGTEGELTTHDNPESENKRNIIAASAKTFLLGDSSKVGICLECTFAKLSDDVTLVTNSDPINATLSGLMSAYPSKIHLV